MRKRFPKLPIIGVMMVFLGLLAACGGKKAPAVDVVNGVPPVSTSLAGVRVTMAQLAAMSQNERSAALKRDWPHLPEDVVYNARALGIISRYDHVDWVEILFGSLEHVQARAGDVPAMHEGFAKNQLIAQLDITGKGPRDLFILCLNGMVASLTEMAKLQPLEARRPAEQFTIGRGQGLIPYVDYPVAIDLAERFHIPLYAGREMKSAISPNQARQMEPDTARVQITAGVFEGDKFDLVANTYTPAPRKTHTAASHRKKKANHKKHRLAS